jgi:hypothetical protein
MKTFAHIETGFALDPIERVDEAAYRALFTDEVVSQWTVAEVPTGTLHNAKRNEDGTYTNPVIPDPVLTPVVFDKVGFKDYCYGKLGATTIEGLTRYGEIIQACRTSTVPAVVAAFDQYEDAQTYRKDRVELFLTVLVSATILEQSEYDAVINGWPTA